MLIIAPSKEYIFSIFFNMKVCCMLSIESPHRGDSNEYTQHTIFNIKKENFMFGLGSEIDLCQFLRIFILAFDSEHVYADTV